MKIGTIFCVRSTSTCQLFSIFTIIIPGPIQRRYIQSGCIQHIFVDKNQIIFHFSRNTICLIVYSYNYIVCVLCSSSFLSKIIIERQVGSRLRTHNIGSVIRRHQNIHCFATHQHNISLCQIVITVHVTYIIKLHINIRMEFLVCCRNLLVLFIMIGLPADKTQSNFLLIFICYLSSSCCFLVLSRGSCIRCFCVFSTGTSY